jgi:CheY-like chemotaxis protein
VASILIVDDELSMRFLLRVAFERAGHSVQEAPNGRVAIDRIESGEVPDLVATDFMMPLLNGGELIARLRRNPDTKEIPVILVSSSPGAERAGEPDAFFQKPFDPDALIGCAAKLLEGAS